MSARPCLRTACLAITYPIVRSPPPPDRELRRLAIFRLTMPLHRCTAITLLLRMQIAYRTYLS
jgi:hypothetical protein